MEWYYAVEGESVGPVSDDVLQGLVTSGVVTDETMVWQEGMGDWVPYKQKKGTGAPPAVPAVSATPASAIAQATPTAQADEPDDSAMTGNTSNGELTAMARASLSGSWGIAIGIYLLLMVVSAAANTVPCALLFVAGPLTVGFSICFLKLARGSDPEVGTLFSGFENFLTCFVAYLLMNVFILLWMMLFIIPGIIASYAYSQTFFILADDPAISASDAIARSKQMMKGMKWKYFCLSCRFIGWAILCIFTFGIGFIWLGPYMSATFAHFYRDVSRRAIEA